MNRILQLEISRCKGQCPYYKWEPNNGCGNSAGSSFCKHPSFLPRSLCGDDNERMIEYNNKDPKIPDWCPLDEQPVG